MEFRDPLLGVTGHHVDLTDPVVIQQEHRLLFLQCDIFTGQKMFSFLGSIKGPSSAKRVLFYTCPSQQNRGHGFFLLMLEDKTTSSFRSMSKAAYDDAFRKGLPPCMNTKMVR